MIRFVHTADCHFGMENYGRIDSKTGIHSRLLDFEKAFSYCVEFAVEQNVDLFVFAGDAYKTPHPTPTHQRLLMQNLLKLYKASIPVVMIVGNHDHPLSFGKTHALEIFGQLPVDGFYVIAKPTACTVPTKSGPVQLVGIPWPTRANIALNSQHALSSAEVTQYVSTSVSKIIETLASELDPTLPAILAGHLTVTSGIFSGSEKRAIQGTDPVFMPSQLAIAPFDYVALGHLHRYQNLNAQGYPPIIYSGSIERIDFGERREDKGFCDVTLHEKGHTTHEFIKVPTRSFIQIELHLNEIQSQTDQILQELMRHSIKDAVIKIIYHVPQGKKDRVDINVIQQACSSAWYIVGIIPIRIPAIRERRATLNVDMDLGKLLNNYFDTKPEYRHKKEALIEKALLIERELNEQESN